MAQKTKTVDASQDTEPKRRGRRPGQEINPENSAKRLSEAVSRATWYLSGSPGSGVGILAARAAKQGIERARVERGFEMIQQALEIARTQMEAAYAAPKAAAKTERPSVSL